jgi:hypothetical protein
MSSKRINMVERVVVCLNWMLMVIMRKRAMGRKMDIYTTRGQ